MEKSKLWQYFYECRVQKYITVENEGDYAVILRGDTLSIYFQWSRGEEDWKNNFDFVSKPYKDMEITWYCHRGFLKVWKSIEPYLEDYINNFEVKKIEIIGYSHGAAIAQLCYEYVKFHRPEVEVVGVGFGAPRVFWGPMKKEIEDRFNGFIVVRNGKDIVTHVPPCFLGFRHVGKVITVGESKGWVKDHYPSAYAEALRSMVNKGGEI